MLVLYQFADVWGTAQGPLEKRFRQEVPLPLRQHQKVGARPMVDRFPDDPRGPQLFSA